MAFLPEQREIIIKRILALDLSEQSHGNAQGLAEFTTEKLIHKIDRKSTYLNALTSTFFKKHDK